MEGLGVLINEKTDLQISKMIIWSNGSIKNNFVST